MKYLAWSGEGVYVPQVRKHSVMWWRDKSGNPLYGVQVNSPEHGTKIADVFAIDNHGNLRHWAAQSAEMAA